MAKIPRYESQRQFTNVSPAVRIDPHATGQGQRDIQAVTSAIGQLADHFEKIATNNEITKADTLARRQLKELELEATTSEDLNPKSYSDRIKKIGLTSAAGISLGYGKRQFINSFNNLALNSEFNIKRTLNNRLIDDSLAELGENLDAMEDSFITAPSVQEQNRLVQDMNIRIDGRVADGMITRVNGDKLKKGTLIAWREAEVDFDIENNSELAAIELIKGKDGKYKDLPPKTRKTKIALAETMTKKKEEQEDLAKSIIQTKNELDASLSFFKGTLTPRIIEDLFRTEEISLESTKALRAALVSPDTVKAKDDDAVNTKLLDKYYALDESDLGKLRTFRNEVLIEHSKGKLSKDGAEFLINKTVDPFTQQKAKEKFSILKALEAIKNWTTIVQSPLEFFMKKTFLSKVEGKNLSEEEIETIANDTINDIVSTENPIYTKEDLEFTASETGLTIEEVMKALRVKEGR